MNISAFFVRCSVGCSVVCDHGRLYAVTMTMTDGSGGAGGAHFSVDGARESVGLERRWGYALVGGDGYVLATWTLDAGPDSDAAADEGTARVLASGDEQAYWTVAGRVQ